MNLSIPKSLLTFAAALVVNLCLAQSMPATDLPPEMNKWMTAIVQIESNNKPWAILNNTYFREKTKPAGGFFPSREKAEEYANKHIGMGHDLDLGKYQLNWKYQKNRPGVTLANIFDPYVQEQIGKAVLKEFYLKAKKTYGLGELAERRAVSAYNNGNVYADNTPYLTKVYKQLGKSVAGLSGSDSGASTSIASEAGTAKGSGIGADGAVSVPANQSKGAVGETTTAAGMQANSETASGQQTANETEGGGVTEFLTSALGILLLIAVVLLIGKFLGVALKLGAKKALMKVGKSVYNMGKQAEQDARARM